jgi:transposase
VVRPRYEWCYVYGFVRPATGETWWLLMPTVSAEAWSAALAAFAEAVGAGAGKRVVLAIDQAGWHTAAAVAVPQGLHPAFLPAYSPELQPAERLWGPVDEALANRAFATLAELEAALETRCLALAGRRADLRGRVRYHWWPVAWETTAAPALPG